MKLNNFYNLIFETIEESKMSEREVAYKLGLAQANISLWKANKRIPEKHFRPLAKLLKIPNDKAILALKKDIAERFR